MPHSKQRLLAVIVLAATSVSLVTAAAAGRATGVPKKKVLVELYTSQG